jgi:hypothetical protein
MKTAKEASEKPNKLTLRQHHKQAQLQEQKQPTYLEYMSTVKMVAPLLNTEAIDDMHIT